MTALVPDITLSASESAALDQERVVISTDDALFHVQGSGAIACVQGILTNDVAKATPGQAIWGAVLTPKGMIISDAWVLRDDPDLWIAAPGRAHQVMRDLLARTMPPRLAKVTDRTDAAQLVVTRGGVPDGVTHFVPEGAAPFRAAMIAPRDGSTPASLDGWRSLPPLALDAAKLHLGWPVLGREIDEKTLPQEVRFDELGGVKYDKGCYTGQETVARLHFRGHANRLLRGVRWSGDAYPTSRELSHEGKSVGTIRTLARIGDALLATAIVRREVEPGRVVASGESSTTVVELPFTTG